MVALILNEHVSVLTGHWSNDPRKYIFCLNNLQIPAMYALKGNIKQGKKETSHTSTVNTSDRDGRGGWWKHQTLL